MKVMVRNQPRRIMLGWGERKGTEVDAKPIKLEESRESVPLS